MWCTNLKGLCCKQIWFDISNHLHNPPPRPLPYDRGIRIIFLDQSQWSKIIFIGHWSYMPWFSTLKQKFEMLSIERCAKNFCYGGWVVSINWYVHKYIGVSRGYWLCGYKYKLRQDYLPWNNIGINLHRNPILRLRDWQPCVNHRFDH